jgi:hypothetical protein
MYLSSSPCSVGLSAGSFITNTVRCCVNVPFPFEFSSFIVDHSIVAHLYLSGQLKPSGGFTYIDWSWIPVGPLGCSALDEVDELP